MPEVSSVEPLKITAVMAEPVTFNFGTVAMDALLCSQVARRDGLPDLIRGRTPEARLPIPIEWDPMGFYLASWAIPSELLWSHTTHIHKPPPIDWYQRLCTDKVKRIDTGTKEDKAWRVPRFRQKFRSLTWYCLGNAEEIEVLLRGVTRIGSCRRDGVGKRKRWVVELCETWPGFPVLKDGKPLRSLPLEHPGLVPGFRSGQASLRPPYWEPYFQEITAIP